MNRMFLIALIPASTLVANASTDQVVGQVDSGHSIAEHRSNTAARHVQKWIEYLGHPQFRKRELAAQKLKNGGLAAAEALVRVRSDELEVKLRVVHLLSHLLKQHQPSNKGVSMKTLAYLSSEEMPVVHRWALKVLAKRHKNGCSESLQVLEQLCQSRNKEIARLAVDVLYPLPSDRKTKRLVDIVAQFQHRIDAYREKIEKTKKRTDLGELSKMIDIDSYQEAIEHNEKRLNFFAAELLKRRMEVQEKR